MDTNGVVRITGRYKELIIGAGGENIAPVPVEEAIKKAAPALSNVGASVDHKFHDVSWAIICEEQCNVCQIRTMDDIITLLIYIIHILFECSL